MSYNWKCCSFYPNNFDASALAPLTLYIMKRLIVVLTFLYVYYINII